MAAAPGSAVTKMSNFFATCTPEQIGDLMQVLQATQDKNVAGSTYNAASTMTVKAGVSVKKTGKKQRNKKAKTERVTGGPKRPLNSWMAFRKYYNRSLAPNTQKAISKVLTVMWRHDLCEAKWAMLAKSYSVVRGSREKEDAPLDEFLDLCAPLIGIIPPENYRQVMGWQLMPADEGDKEKVPNLVRVAEPMVPPQLLTTTLSVDDLVQHCYAAGYIKDGGEDTVAHSTSGSLTMAVQPTTTALDGMMEAREANIGESANPTALNTMLPPLSPSAAEFENALRVALEQAPEGAASLAEAAVSLNNLGSQYPHDAAFDPTSNFDITFEPNTGDAWHAQSVSGLTNGDLDWDALLNFADV